MDILEFDEVVKLCFKQLSKIELDTLFMHFDKRGLGTITKDDFQRGLNQPLSLENQLHFYLHDFMTPLKTLLAKKNVQPATVFDIFSHKSGGAITLESFK